LQYNFWIGFEFEKLESLYCYLEKTQDHSMRPIVMITIVIFCHDHDSYTIVVMITTVTRIHDSYSHDGYTIWSQ